ncbi:MAG: UvrD-helicase domain-containing protein [Pirellulales bacterium]
MANSAKIAAWKPVDVKALELAADDAVRRMDNALVVAGPGAGKTELLAQRACFLLQTGICASPRRILAISFKRDAARNLRERVSRRCGRELASRFDSYTFDSFAKNLVDRFTLAIPKPFRPSSEYRVLTSTDLNDRKLLEFVRAIPTGGTVLSTARREGLNQKQTWKEFVDRPLPQDGKWTNTTDEQIAAADLWAFLLHNQKPSNLGFPMIGRMAALILRANPMIVSALQKSYQFLFLDEFQDTTTIYYDLLRDAFLGSNCVITAVGDNKQRIMIWAGAMRNVFDQFCTDFNATKIYLKHNHRSSDVLVKIQSVVAKKLDPNAAEAISMVAGKGGKDACQVIHFENEQVEAQKLAKMIRRWIVDDGLNPRDICVLCRMKPPQYTEQLRAALDKVNVRSRVENELQDLLSEPLVEAILDVLKLACRQSSPEAWGRTLALLAELRGDDSELGMRRIIDSLLKYSQILRQKLQANSATNDEIQEIVSDIMKFLGDDAFRTAYPQYLQNAWYASVLADITRVLADARAEYDWPDAIEEVEGVDSVPIMTTHKSKGLEYHTVVFIGLEDSAHFGFGNNPDEETCGFFVALSRAKQRVLFTFCKSRPTGRSGTVVTQQRKTVAPLYQLLATAGVEVQTDGK